MALRDEGLLPGENVLGDTGEDNERVVASVAILDSLSLAQQAVSDGRWTTVDRVVLRRPEMESLARLLISLGYGKDA